VKQIRISAWAIRNPIPVTVLFVLLTIAGLISYASLPIKQFPNVSFPAVVVTVTQNGASPVELETQVTRVVEDALAGIAGVDSVVSSVVLGASTTTVNFEIGEDEQRATDEVQSAVDQVRQVLPREIDEPIVTRIEFEAQPIVTYAVSAPAMTDEQLSWFIDDTVSRALLAKPGVSGVNREGGVDREIAVTVYPDRLAQYGLTAPQLNDALRTFSVDAPGGRVEIGGREQTVRVLGAAETLEQLRNLTIPVAGGRYVRLTDVADVGDGASEARAFARLDGRPSVGFNVQRTKDSSELAVEDAVREGVAELAKAHPGVTFVRVVSIVDDTRANYEATLHVLFEGMGLAALVVLLFLRNWRATLITALAMPLALIPTFSFMVLFGFSLNVVTLLALTLVIGILVDDAIVEIENIEKRVERGESPYDAAMVGADQIGLAVVATTMAIVVIFAPVSFMPGMAGQFFKEFGLTVVVAVLFSLVVARLVTPLMAAYFLKPTVHKKPEKPFNGWYRRTLDWALDHRYAALGIGTLLFIGSLALIPLIPAGFQPASNYNFMLASLQGPAGATRSDMEQAVQEATDLFMKRPEVAHVFASVGGGSGGGGPGGFSVSGGDLRNASLTIILHEERDLTVVELKEAMRDSLRSLPDVRASFQGEFGSAEVATTLTSNDGQALERAALELQRQMRGLSEVADIRPAEPPPGPELIITPKPDEAARLGVSSFDLANIARIATIGDIDANVAKFTVGERRLPIRVRLPEGSRESLSAIGSLRVPTAGGGTTTLESVADIRFQSGPAQINRYDRRRQQAVYADLAGGASLGQATQAINALPIMQNLPAGVTPAPTGDVEAMGELFGSLGAAMFAGVAMIFAVLVLLFRSFFKPITILSALPLSIGGAFLGLLATGLELSLPSLIGFLMLLGLAAKNSILLVEYAIEEERAAEEAAHGRDPRVLLREQTDLSEGEIDRLVREGKAQNKLVHVWQRKALIDACRERARPIVMTTLAMMAGMLPTALALGEGAEFRQPMAVAVIGGLITSTALSLVLVPVVYEFVDDFERWITPKLARLTTPRTSPTRGEDPPPAITAPAPVGYEHPRAAE
jgi:HAE1 family hydrophobic/amphiphilic exporter-1